MTTSEVVSHFEQRWADIAPIGRDPVTGGYRRFAYEDAELTLREWFTSQAQWCGLDVHEDRAGNLWAWWGDPTNGNAVATGSHLDSVPQGGAYDGPLGLLAGLGAIETLRARGIEPRRPIAVVAFADEEGSRFGVPCAGSRLLTGNLSPERALSLIDESGVTLAQALHRTGRNPASLGPDPEVLGAIGTFVEVHLEQGRGLAKLDRPIAVASAIRAHGRWRLDLHGRADHAGTTLLEDRKDPMLRQAAAVLAARQAARRHTAFATIGRVKVEPNSTNTIPSRVLAWLDARADDEATLNTIVSAVGRAAEATPINESWIPRVDFDVSLRNWIAARLGGAPALTTSAGHDAAILELAGVPTAMLFVRNPTGVSHSPLEHVEHDDCLASVDALAHVLEGLVDLPKADQRL